MTCVRFHLVSAKGAPRQPPHDRVLGPQERPTRHFCPRTRSEWILVAACSQRIDLSQFTHCSKTQLWNGSPRPQWGEDGGWWGFLGHTVADLETIHDLAEDCRKFGLGNFRPTGSPRQIFATISQLTLSQSRWQCFGQVRIEKGPTSPADPSTHTHHSLLTIVSPLGAAPLRHVRRDCRVSLCPPHSGPKQCVLGIVSIPRQCHVLVTG